MRKITPLFALLLVAALGCGGAQSSKAETAAAAKADEAKAAAAVEAKKVQQAAQADAVDVASEIVGTLTITSLDDALAQGTALVKLQLPPAFQAMANPMVLKAQLFASIKAPELEEVLDTTRPLALALADPKAYEDKGLGPVMIAIPVKDPNGLIDFLAKKAKGHETTGDKVHVFKMDNELIYLTVHDGTYALLASNEKLILGAASVLGPLVQGTPGSLAHLRINMEEVYKRFGAEIEKAMTKLQKEMDQEPLGQANTGSRMVTRWMGYVKGMRVIDATLGIKKNDLHFETAMTAKSGSTFSTYMSKLNPGKLWGLEYMPAESGLVAVARDNPEVMLQDLDEALETLTGVLKQWVPKETIEGWRSAARKSIKHYAGVGAGAMWANADGSVGFASASKLRDSKAAQDATREWVSFLGKEVERLMSKTFKKEIQKALPGFKVAIKVKKNGLKVGGVKGDLFQVKFKWPRLKSKKEAEMMAKVKKGLAKVIGKDLTMGYVIVDETALMTFGKDYKQRMKALVAIAKSKSKGSDMVSKLKPYTDGRDIIMAIYAPLETLAEQVLRVADKVTTIPPEIRDAMAKVMPPPNTSVPVALVAHQKGETVSFETSISANLVGMIARGAMHAMTARKAAP